MRSRLLDQELAARSHPTLISGPNKPRWDELSNWLRSLEHRVDQERIARARSIADRVRGVCAEGDYCMACHEAVVSPVLARFGEVAVRAADVVLWSEVHYHGVTDVGAPHVSTDSLKLTLSNRSSVEEEALRDLQVVAAYLGAEVVLHASVSHSTGWDESRVESDGRIVNYRAGGNMVWARGSMSSIARRRE